MMRGMRRYSMSEQPNYFRRGWLGFAVLLIALVTSYQEAVAQVQVSLIISPRPSRYLSDWRTRRETAQLQIVNNGERRQAIIDGSIALEGSILVHTNLSTIQPIDIPQGITILSAEKLFPESSLEFQANVKENVARTGVLPEGEFEICVRLLATDKQTELSRAECRQFSIVFQPPTLITPADGKEFAAEDKLVQFLWSPIAPLPQTPVQYSLRIVEVLPGQTKEVAIRNNTPIVDRTVMNQTQIIWPPEAEQPKPGKEYAWSVSARDDNGIQLGGKDGTSEIRTLQFARPRVECERLLKEVTELKTLSLTAEKKFWEANDLEFSLSRRYQDAEERADIRSMEKALKKLQSARERVKLRTEELNKSRDIYETKWKEYNECANK